MEEAQQIKIEKDEIYTNGTSNQILNNEKGDKYNYYKLESMHNNKWNKRWSIN